MSAGRQEPQNWNLWDLSAIKMQKTGTPDKHETRIYTKVLPTTPKPNYKGVQVQALHLSPQKAPTRTATIPLRRREPVA